MLSMVWSAAVNGIDAYPKEVEVNSGYWATVIVILSLFSPLACWHWSRFKLLPPSRPGVP